MSSWSKDELCKIATFLKQHLATFESVPFVIDTQN
jgi:hypothetical protein